MNRGSTHAFIAPDLGGRPTGGTIYNAHLIAALHAEGVRCEHFTLANAELVAGSSAECVWVDSLYLDALPGLRACTGTRALFLVVHYLPSLVASGRMLEWHELTQPERDALSAADGFLVTGGFMRSQLAHFALGERRIVCVEPGCEVVPAQEERREAGHGEGQAQGIMLCNVVRAKGVLPLLEALARLARADDGFRLRIVGGLDVEPDYANACQQVVTSSASLRNRVVLYGALPHAEALAWLARSDVFLSASRMEAYGMALSEARAAGIPIVARAGGNTHTLVATEAGGTLVEGEADVAARFLELVRTPPLLAARQRDAIAAAPIHARIWRDAALELVSQMQRT